MSATATATGTGTTIGTGGQGQGQQVIPPPFIPAGGGGAGGQGGGGGGGGAGGGGGTPPGAGGAAVPPVIPANFALTPALYSNNFLDFANAADIKLFNKSVMPLETKFDLSAGKMKDFLDSILDKSIVSNWIMTLLIMFNGIQYNLILHYGVLTFEAIRQHALTYLGTATRHAQNSMMMFTCLRDSLTEEARQRVSLESIKYRINGFADGLLYFKVIVGIAHLDTRATVTVIRTRLSSLDTKISDVQDNVIELNEYVKTQQAGLQARGERTEDLLVNLFKAYKSCKDQEFVKWSREKQDRYNEGQDITPEELMTLADNKYQSLLDEGAWLQQSDEQKRIVAMTAKINSWEKNKGKKTDAKKGQANDKKDNKRGKKNNKKKGRFAWLYEAPGPSQPKEKEISGVKWNWCPHHAENGKWVKHTVAECKVRIEKESGKGKESSDNRTKLTESGPMKVAGMVAMYPDDDDF